MTDSKSTECRFAKPMTFATGVQWKPTDYKPIDQTPYLEYLEKNEEKTRQMQEGL